MILKLQTKIDRSRRSAFTLLEMLVVVAIIVLLASVGTYAVMNALEAAKRDTAKVKAKALESAINAYKTRHGSLPNQIRDLMVADDGPPLIVEEAALRDPWGQEYTFSYDAPTNTVIVMSPGQNGIPISSH